MIKLSYKLLFVTATLLFACNTAVEENTGTDNYINGLTTNNVINPQVIKINPDSLTKIPAKGIWMNPDSFATPKVIPAGKPKENLYTGIRPVKAGKPKVIAIDVTKLTTLTPGKDSINLPKTYLIPDSGFSIQHGDTLYAPKVIRAKQPKPVPALSPRYMDNAQYNIQYLDVEQNLSSSFVSSIKEDKNGNLWFGTQVGGLVKYDGSSFITFSVNEGLVHYDIWKMYIDNEGNLWMGTLNGLSKFDGRFFTNFTTKEGLSAPFISSITQDKKGDMWFGTLTNGIIKYDGKSFIYYTEKEGLINNKVRDIIADDNGNIWIATKKGACKFDGISFTHFTVKDGLISNWINDVMMDKSGNIWFGTVNGVCKYDGSSFFQLTTEQGLLDNSVRSLFQDKDENIWLSYPTALSKFNGNDFTNYTKETGLRSSGNVMQDKKGNIWIGGDGGVCKLKQGSFVHFSDKVGMQHHYITSILEDKKENIWIGTNNGLIKYNGRSFKCFTEKEGLTSNGIWFLLEDRSGNIWIGIKNGVCKYNGNSFIHYSKSEGFTDKTVSSIFEDKKGNLWFGTFNGFYKYDGNSFTHYKVGTGIYDNMIFNCMVDSKGNFWFGTYYSGIVKFDGRNFIHLTKKDGLADNRIWYIKEDTRGIIWIGHGKGVSSYTDTSFTNYNEKDGMPISAISSIIEDNNHNLWMGSEKGLYFFEFNKNNFNRQDDILNIKNYSIIDGLKDVFFNYNSAYLGSKNQIWWGTAKCLTMLDLSKQKKDTIGPSIQLNSIRINDFFIDFHQLEANTDKNHKYLGTANNKIDIEDIEFKNVVPFYNYPIRLKLPYHLNHLSFNFSAIDWAAPHKLKYQFKLEGLDNDWSILSKENKADYRNIPYGTYIFKVKAIGAANAWSKTFDYSFVIHPPWWQTWWARVIYIITGILFILIIIRLRTSSLKQRQKELEQTVKVRTLEISEKNEELLNQNEELNQQKDEIETTLEHLKQTQSQLVQSEKMASLGQLIAGIAHEINTPLGAIKSSIGTISETMKQSYKVLPELFRKLPEELMKEFILLLNKSFESNGHYTTSEERKFKKIIIKKLEELNVKESYNLADTLVDMGICEDISPFETLLKDKNAETILNSAYSLSIQYKNSLNIETAVNKASKVVFALKSYSRYGISESKVSANITEGIETVLTLYHNQLKHGIEVKKNFEAVPEIMCYPDELNQVWTNLIHNSIYAMQEKGKLEITVSKTDTTIIVKIKDNGRGIPHEIKDQVFDAFFTTKPTGEGSGLGLDIVKKIIEKHDGSIDFESEAGKWTEFKVVLPIVNSH